MNHDLLAEVTDAGMLNGWSWQALKKKSLLEGVRLENLSPIGYGALSLSIHPSEIDTGFLVDPQTQYLVKKDDHDDTEKTVNVESTAIISDQPDAARDHPTTTVARTFLNFLKGNVGTGVLAMPDAFKNAGLFFGTGSLFFLCLLSAYCCHQLLHAYIQVSDGQPISYSRVAELSFKKAPGRLKKMAKPARIVVDAFLIFSQIGLCCIYILFCSKMMKEVVDSQTNAGPSIQIYETAVLGLLIPYCFVTTLNALSIFTLFANIVTFTTLIVVLQYVLHNLQAVENVEWYPKDFAKLPLFFGTSIFAFEAIGLILPMENRMKERKEFHGWNGLFSMSMAIIGILYVFVGFYGYLAFGSEARMMLSNMPPDDWLYSTLKLLYALGIFLSYNLQLYVPVQIMFPWLKDLVHQPWFDRYGEYMFRTVLVISTYALAIGIPLLELMISLIGALCNASLGLIFPPIIEIVCCFHKGHQHRVKPCLIAKNVAILLFGMFGAIVGTFVSIQSILKTL